MNTFAPLGFNRNSILIVILAPIIVELLRKYIFFSNFWFVLLDFVLVFIFLRTLINFKPPSIFNYWVIILSVFIIHGLVSSILYLNNPLTLLFGIRTAFYPLVGFVVAASIDFSKPFVNRFIIVALTLIILVSAVGFFQIILVENPWESPSHWINYVPPEIGYGRSLGFGGYDEKINALFPSVNLYRPHSIFLHTGKFGQVVWGFSALLLLLSRYVTPNKRALIMIVILVCNLITSQRAALYPLILFMAFYLVTFSEHKPKIIFTFFLAAICISVYGVESVLMIIQRFLDAAPEIPERLTSVFFSADDLLRNGLLGDGWSYYATGAHLVGGGNYSDYFGGEGGWIIMAAEVGIPITFCLFLLCGLIGTLIFFKSMFNIGDRYLAFWTGYIIILIPVWAGTHNIFGSYLMMMYTTIPIGLYYNKSFNLSIKNNLI